MALELHVWKLTGLSPLLQNNPANTMTSAPDELKANTKKVYDDQEETDMRVYKDTDGTFYHPATSIRLALLEASKGRKVGKKGARSVVAGAVFPAETRLTILNGNGKPLMKYEMEKNRMKVGTAGILRCRPRFDKWSMKVALEVDTDFVKPDWVTELLNIAGRTIGIGDSRPDTSKGKSGVGSFGRFSAELVS